MKICYLCPDLGISIDGHKGASSHIRGFVNAMTRRGHKVFIVTSCPVKEGTLDVPVHVIPPPEIIEGILEEPDPRTYRALRHLFYNNAISTLLEELVAVEKPDFIYERYSPFSVAGSIFAKKRKIPHILEVNAPLAEQGKKYRKQALQDASELLELTAFHQAGMIITLTHQLKDWLINSGISPDKINVRPCGVDENCFSPIGPSMKDRFSGKIVLGFVGSLKPWHDIEMLVDIFRKLAYDPRYHLLVVGEGPMKKTLVPLAEEFPDRVTLTGAVDQEEVPQYIRAMDIALAPYPEMDLFYFSPLKVYEYMAMGKPVIATAIGQLEELIRHKENGWLAQANNINEWIEAIQYLASHPELRDKIGTVAAKEIREGHTWDKRAEYFIGLAKEFVERRDGRQQEVCRSI